MVVTIQSQHKVHTISHPFPTKDFALRTRFAIARRLRKRMNFSRLDVSFTPADDKGFNLMTVIVRDVEVVDDNDLDEKRAIVDNAVANVAQQHV